MDKIDPVRELTRGDLTDEIFSDACFGVPVNPQTAEDVLAGIQCAMELNDRPVFLEGLAERLTELGVPCSPDDSAVMSAEVKRRYKEILRKPCPKAVRNWLHGTVPGITNRINNYELCYALEVDFKQTALFFQKHFLTVPFNVKSREDAVFCYCFYHNKPYASAAEMIKNSSGFVPQENAHTSTSQIMTKIMQTEDDAAFMQYLSSHCYNNEQQFQKARSMILKELEQLKKTIQNDDSKYILSGDRLNSAAIAELFGYRYQSSLKDGEKPLLPKRFTESLPNDVTLGKIINGKAASYELLRKTLMMLHFYNFYSTNPNSDKDMITQNLLDFYEETDAALHSCGFAQIYFCHPFDCLLMYCANSYDPILTMHLVNERNSDL
ncbi:MAG: hypothetical protein IJ060_08660 [Oscillospiraceae bacterium]|nr:hypothetical protein [Oscillospiraceae bacterium]